VFEFVPVRKEEAEEVEEAEEAILLIDIGTHDEVLEHFP
jgi:hypothetical protein